MAVAPSLRHRLLRGRASLSLFHHPLPHRLDEESLQLSKIISFPLADNIQKRNLCDSFHLPLKSCKPSESLFSPLMYIKGGVGFRLFSTQERVERRKSQERGSYKEQELRLIRRKRKLMLKNMSEEEKLQLRIRRAKRKEALLLQRLRKYELPKEPEPVHDPELITTEQLQLFKKLGYKNKNYAPVGRRGVFGGVVQNMHMHWKKHETVQVECEHFERHQVKKMARSLAILSGGIVVHIHQGQTILMYRGRNYTQPKTQMIPENTLTKRKALFKSKYEQALEDVRRNMQKVEQELNRMQKKKQKESFREGEASDSHGSKTTDVSPGSVYANLPEIEGGTEDESDDTFSLAEFSDEDGLSADSDSETADVNESSGDYEDESDSGSELGKGKLRHEGEENEIRFDNIKDGEPKKGKESCKLGTGGSAKVLLAGESDAEDQVYDEGDKDSMDTTCSYNMEDLDRFSDINDSPVLKSIEKEEKMESKDERKDEWVSEDEFPNDDEFSNDDDESEVDAHENDSIDDCELLDERDDKEEKIETRHSGMISPNREE